MKTIRTQPYFSPAGEMVLGSFEGRLCLCDWASEKCRKRTDTRLRHALGVEFERGGSEVVFRAAAELDEYFAGTRTAFDLPLLFVGTVFQKRVWNALLSIPYGRTMSYGELARQMGCPTAVRAVANANGANAISIFAPCHRVIGSDGSLTGYGGGLDAKRILLERERRPGPLSAQSPEKVGL